MSKKLNKELLLYQLLKCLIKKMDLITPDEILSYRCDIKFLSELGHGCKNCKLYNLCEVNQEIKNYMKWLSPGKL